MTQPYDHEPHEHEGADEHVNEHAEAEIHEAPSDSEFADAGDITMAGEEKPKGRSALLPLAAAGGVVVLLAGVAWWQFSGSNTNAAANNPVVPPALTATTPAPVLNQPVASKVAATSMAQLNDLASNVAMPANTTTPNAVAPLGDIPKLPNPADLGAASQGTHANAMPGAMPASGATNSAGKSVASIDATPNVPQISAAPNGDSQRMDSLSARLDDMQKTLAQVTEQLTQVSTRLSATPADSEARAMQDRLAKLEQQMAQKHMAAPALVVPAAITGDGMTAPVAAVKPITRSVPQHTARYPKTKHHKEAKTATAVHSSHWVLRAAMPGQAWIATSADDKDLKPVHVGDTVTGIGRVTAIEAKDGDAWVIQGTKGTVR